MVVSFGSFRIETEEIYGGYAKPSYSDIAISPDAFKGNWPPSGDALFKVMVTESDESSATVIFDGYGTPTSFDREGVYYDLVTPEYSSTVTSDTRQSGTLLTLMTSYCSTLGLTFDSVNARATSPSVDYTPSSDEQLIDLMSGMCAFFTHSFKIIEGTLYLHDMLATGATTAITEFDMQPSEYGKAEPITLIKVDEISVSGSSDYGGEESISTAYHVTESLVKNALTNIKTIIEKDTAEIDTMIGQTAITVLDDFTVLDESTIGATQVTAKAISTLYNFDKFTMKIEAIGAVT